MTLVALTTQTASSPTLRSELLDRLRGHQADQPVRAGDDLDDGRDAVASRSGSRSRGTGCGPTGRRSVGPSAALRRSSSRRGDLVDRRRAAGRPRTAPSGAGPRSPSAGASRPRRRASRRPGRPGGARVAGSRGLVIAMKYRLQGDLCLGVGRLVQRIPRIDGIRMARSTAGPGCGRDGSPRGRGGDTGRGADTGRGGNTGRGSRPAPAARLIAPAKAAGQD